MMRSLKVFKVILFVFFINIHVSAQQESNFTLYNFNMNIINPAYAGINDISKLNLVHRYQYLGIDDSPRTTSLIYSKPVGRNLGIGISMLNDRVFILSQTDFALDLSYKLQLNEVTNLYFGMKFGGGFVNIDLTKAHDSNYDPLFSKNQSFFNPHIGSGITLQSEKFYVSFSSPNFLRGQRFEKSGNIPLAAIEEIHYYSGIGYHFFINDNLTFTPNIMTKIVKRAPTSYDIGGYFDIRDKIIAGFNYRLDETSSFYGLLKATEKLSFGFGYDITISELTLVNDNGTLEFMINYIF